MPCSKNCAVQQMLQMLYEFAVQQYESFAGTTFASEYEHVFDNNIDWVTYTPNLAVRHAVEENLWESFYTTVCTAIAWMDEEKLIELVHNCKHLWDLHCADYRDNVKSSNSWNAIAHRNWVAIGGFVMYKSFHFLEKIVETFFWHSEVVEVCFCIHFPHLVDQTTFTSYVARNVQWSHIPSSLLQLFFLW